MTLQEIGTGAGILLDEVARFLKGLRLDLPDVFTPPRVCHPPRPPARRYAGPPERTRAINLLTDRADYWSGRIGVRYRRISVKDQRTLWGSCSRKGNLNFNWRLVLAPPEVVDYVVIHELCHLLEMNHSKRFWTHVGNWCPEQKALRRWLRKHGDQLKRSDALLDIHK